MRELLQRREPPAELVVRPRERVVGIDAELARRVHHGEQQIAEFGFDRFPFPATVRESFRASRFPFELRGLFLHFRERPARIGPVESHDGGALLQAAYHTRPCERVNQSRSTFLSPGARNPRRPA